MKKILVIATSALLLVTSNTMAKGWELGTAMIPDKKIPFAVFLYQDSSIKIGRDATPIQMQFVCTVKKDKALRLIWKDAPNISSADMHVSIDNKTMYRSYTWQKTGNLFYRSHAESIKYIEAMKRGNTTNIRFNHNGVRYDTKFDLSGFTKAYAAFNKACGF